MAAKDRVRALGPKTMRYMVSSTENEDNSPKRENKIWGSDLTETYPINEDRAGEEDVAAKVVMVSESMGDG